MIAAVLGISLARRRYRDLVITHPLSAKSASRISCGRCTDSRIRRRDDLAIPAKMNRKQTLVSNSTLPTIVEDAMKLLTILLTLTLLGGCAMAPHGAVREAGYGGT
jgi:hypothetical protein